MNSKLRKYYQYIIDDIDKNNEVGYDPDIDAIFIWGPISNGDFVSDRTIRKKFLPHQSIGKNIMAMYGVRMHELPHILKMFAKWVETWHGKPVTFW